MAQANARVRHLEEALNDQFDWLGPFKDYFERFTDPSWAGPLTTAQSRRGGGNFPFFNSEQDLSLLRDASRLLVNSNDTAKGLLRGLKSYTVGTGATVRISARHADHADVAKVAQGVADEFARVNRWAFRQQEFFTRSRRDGEAFIRRFPQDDGTTKIRFVWPEQIKQPPGSTLEEWGFGVQTDPDDAEEAIAYAVWPVGSTDPGHVEEVSADEMIAVRLNTDSGVRRGMPDFVWDTSDTLTSAQRLGNNCGVGSAVQAAIAYVRQHTGVPAATIAALPLANADRVTRDPLTGKERQVQIHRPGQIVDTNGNTTFVPSPYNQGVMGHLEVGKMLIRRACVRWNAPEWLGSADASNNNFSSSLTAESPFVLGILSEQMLYADCFRCLFEYVIGHAADHGLNGLPENALELIEITVTMPNPQARDKNAEATRNQTEIAAGYKSPQLAAEEAGYDWRRVLRDRKELAEQGLDVGVPLSMPGGGSPQGGGDGGGQGGGNGGGNDDDQQPNNLLNTVGGSTSITGLQTAYFAGSLSREAALNNAMIVFKIGPDEAAKLFPEKTPADAAASAQGGK